MKLKQKTLSIRQNTLYNTVGSLTYQVCLWLITVLVVRLDSFDSAGIVTLAMSTTNVFFTLATFGYHTFQVSDDLGRYRVEEYVSTRVLSAVVSSVLCAGYSFLLGGFSARTALCISVYMLFRAAEAVSDEMQAIQQKADRMDYICWSFLMRGIGVLAAFVLGMTVLKSILAAFVLMALWSFAVVLAYDWRICRTLSPFPLRFDLRSSVRLLWECAPLMLNSFLMSAILAIPKNTLGTLQGEYIVGIYGSISAPATIIQAAALWLYSPSVTSFTRFRSAGDRSSYFKLFRRVGGLVVGVFVCAMIGSYFLGEWGLTLLFGQEIGAYTHLLIPVLFTTLLIAVSYFFGALLTVARRLKVIVAANAAATVAALALSATLISRMGVDGVNITLYIALGLNAVILFASLVFTWKKDFPKD